MDKARRDVMVSQRSRWLLWFVALPLVFLMACQQTSESTTTVATGSPDTRSESPTTDAGSPSTTSSPDTTAADSTAATDEGPIVVGVSLPLTGIFSIPADKHRAGFELWAELVNESGGLLGREVELNITDNRSDTEQTVNQTERMISVDDVDLLFGTFSSLLTFPASAVAEQAGMVYPIPSGGALEIWSRGFENIFYFQQDAVEIVGETVANTLVAYRDEGVIPADQFPATAAVVHTDDFFSNAIVAGLLGETVELPDGSTVDLAPGFLADAGIEVVYSEAWPAGYTDWLSLANSIQAADADILLAAPSSPSETIELIQALAVVGYQPDVMWSAEGAESEAAETLGSDINGLMVHTSWHESISYEGLLGGEPFSGQDFIDAFAARFDRNPDEDEAIPFAVAQGMEQAVRAVGSTDNAAIREWLHSRTADSPVRTIMGDFHWDDRGLAIDRDYLMTQWQDGELRFVYPVGEFENVTPLVFPKPQW